MFSFHLYGTKEVLIQLYVRFGGSLWCKLHHIMLRREFKFLVCPR